MNFKIIDGSSWGSFWEELKSIQYCLEQVLNINLGVPLKLYSYSKSVCKLLKSTKDVGSDLCVRRVIEWIYNHNLVDGRLLVQFVLNKSNMMADVLLRSKFVQVQSINVQIDKTQVKVLHEN